MSKHIHCESPLAEFSAEQESIDLIASNGLTMEEQRFVGHINLRGNHKDMTFVKGVETVLGLSPPMKPNTFISSGRNAALWLGPDEYLLLVPGGKQVEVVQGLEDAFEGQHVAVNDLSSGQTIIRLQGVHARNVINKGCSLDLHPRVFVSGMCAQSHIGKASATIMQISEVPTFDIIVRRSYADYMARWLKEAGLEYRINVVNPPPNDNH